MTLCKNCGKGIKWFKDPVNDKWIPLEADCNLEYESPEEVDLDEVLQWKHKCTAVLRCNNGCGTPIYFDPNNKSSSGKMIPIEIATHQNHTCGGRQQEESDFPISHDTKSVSRDIEGYDDIKFLVRRALDSYENYNLLFVGPPASANALFLLGILECRRSQQAQRLYYYLEYWNAGKASTSMPQMPLTG